jgi:hypothetical protein
MKLNMQVLKKRLLYVVTRNDIIHRSQSDRRSDIEMEDIDFSSNRQDSRELNALAGIYI